MESILTQDWAQFGMAGMFILYMIWDKQATRNERAVEKLEHTKQKEEILFLLTDSQNARIEEVKGMNAEMVEVAKIFDSATDMIERLANP